MCYDKHALYFKIGVANFSSKIGLQSVVYPSSKKEGFFFMLIYFPQKKL